MKTKYFESILGTMDEADRLSFQQFLFDWGTFKGWSGLRDFEDCNHHRLIENIKQEHFLTSSSFSAIIKDLLDIYNDGDIVKCLVGIRKRIWNYYLQKGELIMGKPVFVATSMPKKTFYNWLYENDMMEEDVVRLLEKHPEEYTDTEKKLILKEPHKLVWLSWDEDCESDAFRFLQEVSRDIVCDAFALDDSYRKDEMISFHFKLEHDTTDFYIYRPTWCDAGFFDKFCPTDPDIEMKWGLTMPERSYPIIDGKDSRRPEGIILAAHLNFKHLSNILPLPI